VRRAIARFVDSGALGDVLDSIDAIAKRTLESDALRAVPALGAVAERLVELATQPIQHCRALRKNRGVTL
jgi:hypothetical protein